MSKDPHSLDLMQHAETQEIALLGVSVEAHALEFSIHIYQSSACQMMTTLDYGDPLLREVSGVYLQS